MSEIIIYTNSINQIQVEVDYENGTLWLNLNQISQLFEKDKSVISRHIKNIFKEGELETNATVAKNATVQIEGNRTVIRKIDFYNLDVILAVGYRVSSYKGTLFRKWATEKLNSYLVQGYAINEKRLAQKQQEVEYLKTGIRILNRAIEQQATQDDSQMLVVFAKGLSLLDDFDHQTLETEGITVAATIFPSFDEYMKLIQAMYSEFASDVFAQPKDESFHSSINQIAQSFNEVELYPTIEEKAANLLYFITKNHSFVDGNKRIAAACFLLFLERNNALYRTNGTPLISNEALAALTLFIATSKTEEADIVKHFIISILNQRH
jgi:prophage maintenance system killer protein